MSKKWILQTQKGYDFFEVSSACQKSIRRGLEKESCYWATELYQSKFDGYLWKRLLIMVSEDIGLANPQLPQQMHALYENYKLLKSKKDDHAYLSTLHAVMLCVRSPKSRVVDWAKCYYIDTHNMHNLDIPDFALDIHTKRGKKMGKTIKHFFTEGSLLENHEEQEQEKFYRDEVENLYCNMSVKELRDKQNVTEVEGKIKSDEQKELF
tara:strand:- start:1743 stop:2369 length:627 start_codon:yes stop_codon:yes gene_type:complete